MCVIWKTSEALLLRQKAKLIAPDLLVAECANISE
jgi:hypothetical protein